MLFGVPILIKRPSNVDLFDILVLLHPQQMTALDLNLYAYMGCWRNISKHTQEGPCHSLHHSWSRPCPVDPRIKVVRDQSACTISLSQPGYIKSIIDDFNMSDCNLQPCWWKRILSYQGQCVRIPITSVITYTTDSAIYVSLCLFDGHLTFHPYHFVTPLSPTLHNCIFRLFNIRGSEGVVHPAKLQQVSKN